MKVFILLVVLFGLIFSTSFGLVAYGDKLLKQDHIAKAKTVYQVAKVLAPFNPTVTKRLLAANILLEEAKADSEETTDSISVAQNSSKLPVLGVNVVIPILMYHYIRVNPDPANHNGTVLSVPPANFGAQMDWLASHGYNTITPDDLVAALTQGGLLPAKPVILTIDDGYEDLYLNAYPILKNHGFRAISFIITDLIENPIYLKWSQIDDMKNSKIIVFGSHTLSHRRLALLDSASLQREVAESKAILQAKLGYPINWIAYPYGSIDGKVVSSVQQAGYTGGFGTNTGRYISSAQQYTLPRILISGYDSLESFAAKLPWQ